jgi:flagellar hook protein FlgE
MVDALYPTQSALWALGKKLEVTANNVANVDTEGFKKSRVIFQESSPSGVMVSINRVDSPGSPLPTEEGKNEKRESSNVDVGEEIVNLITTKHAYTANLKTIKAEEEILGTLLDVLDK